MGLRDRYKRALDRERKTRPSFPARDTSQSDSFFSDMVTSNESPRARRRQQQSDEGTVAGKWKPRNGETRTTAGFGGRIG